MNKKNRKQVEAHYLTAAGGWGALLNTRLCQNALTSCVKWLALEMVEGSADFIDQRGQIQSSRGYINRMHFFLPRKYAQLRERQHPVQHFKKALRIVNKLPQNIASPRRAFPHAQHYHTRWHQHDRKALRRRHDEQLHSFACVCGHFWGFLCAWGGPSHRQGVVLIGLYCISLSHAGKRLLLRSEEEEGNCSVNLRPVWGSGCLFVSRHRRLQRRTSSARERRSRQSLCSSW